MANKAQVLAIFAESPGLSCQAIAAELGTSREYVYATLRRNGLVPVGKREALATPRELRATAKRYRERALRLEAKADQAEARRTPTDSTRRDG